jgi:hypothetical protein
VMLQVAVPLRLSKVLAETEMRSVPKLATAL